MCGLRRPADVAVAVQAGATYLGVVYAGGPRRVTDVEAREVVAAAEGTPVLAVWGPPDREAILRSRELAGFTGVQLHGGSDVALAQQLRDDGLIVWRVLRIGSESDLSHLDHMMEGADAVLIEPRVAGVQGGAGVPLDLALAAEARRRFDAMHLAPRTSHFALAGGLRPDTVRAAIAAVRPDIVDVSSGVERSPGVKDPFLIRRFLDESLADPTPP
ncbi:MAG TPA: phosphoribosylanthranilate isomerase [Gemmatimonadales bacterium]|nr:phosphoribosylanthranilate isomerase [Gemmatimonadales bacterium]